VLSDEDRRRVREEFGADDAQVERDHLISHVLAVLSLQFATRIRLFGGTALSRTYLPGGRLSEDLDLIAVAPRSELATDLQNALSRALSREFGRPNFAPDLVSARGATAAVVSFPSGVGLRLQLLPGGHYPPWPFALTDLKQRFADAGPAALQVPTRSAFVAWKTVAWLDRASPRDLWDLAMLADIGAFDREARDLFVSLGTFASIPAGSRMPPAPSIEQWQLELSHQTRLSMAPAEARERVVAAWRRVT